MTEVLGAVHRFRRILVAHLRDQEPKEGVVVDGRRGDPVFDRALVGSDEGAAPVTCIEVEAAWTGAGSMPAMMPASIG